MAISRRKFAQTAGVTIVGIGLAGAAGKVFSRSSISGDLFPLPAESFAGPVMSFNSDAFLPYLGTIFQPSQNGIRKTSLQLTEVFIHQYIKKQPLRNNGDSFSLLFRSVGRNALPQKTYTFEHASLGTFSLFVAPVGRGPKVYEAVIVHL
jgi:hypothetical protein